MIQKRWLQISSILLGLLLAYGARAWAQESGRPEVLIASWNIRMLSTGSRDDEEVGKIADMISRFDLVAVQEARDTQVLDRIVARLPGWTHDASPPVGRGQKEIYAFLWNTTRVEKINSAGLVSDEQDRFIREPYVCTFRAGEFDFTLCTIHLLFGNSEADRREELVWLDEVVTVVDAANGPEDDVILLGDFNFPPDDSGWQLTGRRALFVPPIKTTIGDKSLYDNIWIHPGKTAEFTGAAEIIRFDEDIYEGDLREASRELSDHRPICASFFTDEDDDTNLYGSLAALVLEPVGSEVSGSGEALPSASIGVLELSGTVVTVNDGDTLRMRDAGGSEHRIRLHGVDCPEKNQEYGGEAAEFTQSACLDQSVKVRVMAEDRYGRSIGIVVLPSGEVLNDRLLEAGLAWWYHPYAPDRRLGEIEIGARLARKGLWLDANPVPPWVFRNRLSEE